MPTESDTSPPSESKLTVIVVSSGKGGVGKSIISSCMAQLLSSAWRVMLIDTDNAAKGSTFLHGSVTEWKDKSVSFNAYLNGTCEIEPTGSTGQLDFPYVFIPSDTNFEQPQRWPDLDQVEAQLQLLIESLRSSRYYDYLILDCRAGADEIFLRLASVADRIIVICEPDEISLDSALDLRGQVKSDRERVSVLVNKAPSGYQTRKHRILEQLNFLSPVPFDERLYRKFIAGARELTTKGFSGTSFRNFVGRALKETLVAENLYVPSPTLFDNIRTGGPGSKTFVILLSLVIGAAMPVVYIAEQQRQAQEERASLSSMVQDLQDQVSYERAEMLRDRRSLESIIRQLQFEAN